MITQNTVLKIKQLDRIRIVLDVINSIIYIMWMIKLFSGSLPELNSLGLIFIILNLIITDVIYFIILRNDRKYTGERTHRAKIVENNPKYLFIRDAILIAITILLITL